VILLALVAVSEIDLEVEFVALAHVNEDAILPVLDVDGGCIEDDARSSVVACGGISKEDDITDVVHVVAVVKGDDVRSSGN